RSPQETDAAAGSVLRHPNHRGSHTTGTIQSPAMSRACTGSVDAKDFPPSFGVSFVCGLPAGHVFVRSQVAESLVGPDVIVGLFPVTEEDVVGVQPLRNLLQVIEFLLMRPMGAFHMAIEPRGARREHKQFDPERGARRF